MRSCHASFHALVRHSEHVPLGEATKASSLWVGGEEMGNMERKKICLFPLKVILEMYVLAYISSARELESTHASQGILDWCPSGFKIF